MNPTPGQVGARLEARREGGFPKYIKLFSSKHLNIFRTPIYLESVLLLTLHPLKISSISLYNCPKPHTNDFLLQYYVIKEFKKNNNIPSERIQHDV